MAAASERSPLLPKDEDGDAAAARPSCVRRLCAWCSRTKRIAALAVLLCACVIFAVFRGAYHERASSAIAEPIVEKEEFDAIVVGGGPAGSIMARLLSDDSWRRVLLIEAGDASQTDLGGNEAIPMPENVRNLTRFDVPYFWTSVANIPSLHWDYPDVNIAKALGGCGIHNAMLYVRALPSDIEKWNMKDWTWEKALQLYLAMEDYAGESSAYHSNRGFLRTSPPNIVDDVSKAFVEACEYVGIPKTHDFNAPSGRFGAGLYTFNMRDGVRESIAQTFLGPILRDNDSVPARKNLRLMLNTTVERISITDDLTAEGVQVSLANGTRKIIRLRPNGTVVVTAGAINTPKVLMRSGIGDGDALNKLNITVKKHLPRVGMNLQDHPVVAMTFASTSPTPMDVRKELESYFNATQMMQSDPASYGVMGSAGISAGAFLIPPGSTTPDIQLTFFPQKSEPHVTNSRWLNHSSEILVTITVVNPHARNRITLVPREDNGELIPFIEAQIPVNETEDLSSSDMWKLAWGVTVVRQIATIMAGEHGAIGEELSPGADIETNQELEKWVRESVFRNTHWVGSAAMGHSEEDGVVDGHLRVFGVKQLRVADASVIPFIPNGNVHSTVVMAAFHGAELLKQDELMQGSHKKPFE